jgi:O-antigen ligase
MYRAADMELPWQPLSMVQAETWNTLFWMIAPLAMLLVTLALSEQRHRQLLHIFIGIGFVSGVLGMLQAIGPANGPLYLYEITNNGTSVGLFANRNHQAAMLASLLPLLAASLSLFRGRPDRLFFHRAVTWAFAALVVPFVLMTGSRSGLVLTIVAAALAWWVYRSPEASGRVVGVRSEHRSRLVGLGVAFVGLLSVALVAVRTPALHRLLESDPAADTRVMALPTVLDSTAAFFPFGSGFGTFVEAYEIREPNSLIAETYFNHAHNDYLELAMTGGVPALLLLAWALGFALLVARSLIAGRKTGPQEPGFAQQVLGRAGFAVLALLAVASATDYPLRVPSVSLYATVAAVWCWNAFKSSRNKVRRT